MEEERLLAAVDHPANPPKDAPVRISWLRYKNETRRGYLEGTTSLWLVPLEGQPRLLFEPEGRLGCLTVAGDKVVYSVGERHSDSIEEREDIRLRDLASGADHLLGRAGPVEGLAIGPGRHPRITAIAADPEAASPGPKLLWEVDGFKPLFPEFDVSYEYTVEGDSRPLQPPCRLAFTASGDVVVAATVDGDVGLFRANPDAPRPLRLTPPGTSVTDFAVNEAGNVAACLERPDAPAEVHLLGQDAGKEAGARVSALNVAWAEERALRHPETLRVSGRAGTELSGVLYLPDRAGRHPLVIRLHGGPHLCAGSGFSLQAQVELAAGYAVLLPNVRGSSGQGKEFWHGSVSQWGRGDFDDLIDFVDTVAAHPAVDASRLYLCGGSYGGFLTNWTLTRTNRFRAAVSERSLSNFLSKYGTADNGFTTNRAEMGGADLFDDAGSALLWQRSPLRWAGDISTPLLLLHGEEDRRVPIEQSEQLFVALRRLGKEVELVRFPDEGHGMVTKGKPRHRVERMEMMLSWFDSHP